jgi:hypothetical protein
MKRFKVRIVTDILIRFDSDDVTEDDAREIAYNCQTARAMVAFDGVRKSGHWEASRVAREVTQIREEGNVADGD